MRVPRPSAFRWLRARRWLIVPTIVAVVTNGVAIPLLPGTGPAVLRAQASVGFVLDAGDLRFIFQQIQIAQNHAANPANCNALAGQLPDPRLPFGLRTVDGTCNHLGAGQTAFGAADQTFPRLTTKAFRTGDVAFPDFDGPGPFQAIPAGASYDRTSNSSGNVADTAPRTISNLIVDQTTDNPAARELAGLPANYAGPRVIVDTPNEAPDEGLSAPFNSMFTFFGQFFDHGLDLVNKGGSGTVFIPLTADDPLRTLGPDGDANTPDAVPPSQAFQVLTRASVNAQQEATNQTTPFVDQNQTYTSHPSHQVFLREYELAAGRPVSTGRLLDGALVGNIANWTEVKAQAATLLGIQLVDADVTNGPLLATDPYGRFIPGPARGMPQIVTNAGLVEGDPGAPIPTTNALRTGHAFLDDIAHNAAPRGNPDGDNIVNPSGPLAVPNTYDDELLGAHFITGDGRGNENIALTAVHTVFHSEHNRLRKYIDDNMASLLTPAEVTAWHAVDAASGWNYGERLFQAARFVTEMQYQHLVFEEFARKLVPSINPFVGDGINFNGAINPAITAEFAHAVYRLGHSMLNETVARTNPADGAADDLPLLEAFLNPREFNGCPANPGNPLVECTYPSASAAAGAILQGSAAQVGNEIDEFVTDVLRNSLLGLPLDLATLNLARGRSEALPSLNEVRRQLHLASGDPALRPYANWFEFQGAMKHPESIVNFVAAYSLHPSVQTATTLVAKRAAAQALVDIPAFRFGVAPYDSDTGFNNIDLWMGGLAERNTPFGSMLGSTFTYIFEQQLENLQNSDRFYYLERLDGLNLLAQMEGNSLSEIVMRNTTARRLPADVFSRPGLTFNVANLVTEAIGSAGLGSNNVWDDPITSEFENLNSDLVRVPDATNTLVYSGGEHVIWNGRNLADVTNSTDANDMIWSGIGDDTLRGGDGNDLIEGGHGNDQHIGGAGDDILTDMGGEDVMKGGPGNDAINGGSGPFDLLQGNEGNDFIVAGNDNSEIFGGPGNDIMFTGDGFTESFGGSGDDWLEGGNQLNLLVGDENNQFQNDPNGGHDVIIGGAGDDDFDSEGGDDIMVAGVAGTDRLEGMLGFDWVTYRGDPNPVDADMNVRFVLPPTAEELRDRFDLAEALSGWNQNDTLRGEDSNQAALEGASGTDHVLTSAGIARITGLQGLLNTLAGPGPAVTSFAGGNIILGGLGSDIIEGRGGDDLIDGDAWLNVQLRAPNPATADTTDVQFADNLSQLRADVFLGRINPGAISIVRSIVDPVAPVTDIDIAVFSGPRADYDISTVSPGVYRVAHARGTLVDGIDTVRHIERLQFADVTLTVGANVSNTPATGAPVLSQLLPQEGELLSAITTGIADANGLGVFSFQWQVDAAGGAATFVNIAGANGASFSPTQAEVGGRLQVVASFIDGGGTQESVTSAPSGVVGDVFVGTGAANNFTGTAGRDNASGLGGNDVITTGDGADQLFGDGGNDILNAGGGNDVASGGAGTDSINAGAGDDIVNGGDGGDTISGGTGADTLRGDGGADTINGNAGSDLIEGGAGNDSLNGGADPDVFVFGPAFGNDTITGFDANPTGGQDTLNVNGLVTAGTFGARVTIAAAPGGGTRITIRTGPGGAVVGTITLLGVAPAAVTIADFTF